MMGAEARQSPDGATALKMLTLVARDLTHLYASMQANDWERPTPCTEWTLRDLSDHVTGGNRFTIRIFEGDTSQEALAFTRRSFAGDHDTRQALVSSTLQLEDCFAAPGILDQICHHVHRDLSGHEVLRLRLHDLIIHTWDAAQALRATLVEIRPELVIWALADIAADPLTERHFGLELPSAGDGKQDQSTLLAAFGR